MTILPHLAVTTLGAQILGLRGADLALAYTFGYAIDLVDHPIKLSLHLRKNAKRNEKQYDWRTPLQEPIALLWIIPLSVYLGTAVPVIFFASHFLLDYMVGYEKRPFFPFSTYSTDGILTGIPDMVKEIAVTAICGIASLILGYEAITRYLTGVFS